MIDPTRWRRACGKVPGVRAATPFVLQQALLTSPGGKAHGGLVRGVDTGDSSGDGRSERAGAQREGGRARDNEGGILLGSELARLLGVLAGRRLTVISPKGALTAVGMVPKMRQLHRDRHRAGRHA